MPFKGRGRREPLREEVRATRNSNEKKKEDKMGGTEVKDEGSPLVERAYKALTIERCITSLWGL